jgi:hypothetical protein
MAGPDLSGLSDADVKALASGDMKSVSEAGLRHLSGAPPPPPEGRPTVLGQVAHGVGTIADIGADVYHTLRGEPTGTPGGPDSYAARFENAFPKDTSTEQHTLGGDLLSQGATAAGHAVSTGYDALAGTGPKAAALKDTLAERVPQAAEAVSTVAGAGGLAAGGAGAVAARTAAGEAAIPGVAGRLVNAGYKLRPSTVEEMSPESAGKVPGTLRQKALETPGDVRQLNMDNAVNTNRRISNQIGAQGMTDEDLEAAKTPHNDVYNKTAASVPDGAPVSSNLGTDLDKVARNSQATSPGAQAQIEKLVANTKANYADGVNGRQLLDDMSTYRAKARKLFNTDAPDNWDIAAAHRQVADALEDELGRQAPGQLTDFQNSRTSLAQINNAQTALRGGSYDPAILARMRGKGVPLSGALEDAAVGGEFAPKDILHPQSAPQAGLEEVHTAFQGGSQAARAAAKKVLPASSGTNAVTKAAQSAWEKYTLEHAQQHLHDLSASPPAPAPLDER